MARQENNRLFVLHFNKFNRKSKRKEESLIMYYYQITNRFVNIIFH